MRDIIKQLKALRPGERVIYHVGFLDVDRFSSHELNIVASMAWDLYRAHRVVLIQRRLSPPLVAGKYVDWNEGHGRGFEYIAVGSYPKKLHVPFITNPLPSIREDV